MLLSRGRFVNQLSIGTGGCRPERFFTGGPYAGTHRGFSLSSDRNLMPKFGVKVEGR
jgi:hypothetical protein